MSNIYLKVNLCYYHVTYTFQSNSTPYCCLNVKELLARNICDIWSLRDRNGIRTHNNLVRKQKVRIPLVSLKSYHWEKVRYLKLRFSKLKKFVPRPVFRELQLTHIPLNFKTTCCILKIRGLRAKPCVAFLLFLFWKELWHFEVKESMLFVDQKYKL